MLPPELLLMVASHVTNPADFDNFSQVDSRTYATLAGSPEQAAVRTEFVKQTMNGIYAAKSYSQVLPWVSQAVALLIRTDARRSKLENRLLGTLLNMLSNHNGWHVPESEKQAALDVAASLGPLAASMTRRDARHYSEWNADIHESWRQTALALMASAIPGEHAARLAALATCVPPGPAIRVAETKRYLQTLAPEPKAAQRFNGAMHTDQTMRNATV